jgi:SulP family sulfate permease
VVLTDLNKDKLKQLENGGYGETFGSLSHQYGSIDFGLEYCEQELINEMHVRRDGKADAWFPKELADQLPANTSPEDLLKSLKKVAFSEGEELVAAGTDEDVAFLIAKGRVDFLVEAPDGELHRLESVSAGMLVGEEQLYEEMLTSYSIVARSDTEAYKITDEILTKLGKENPEIRVALDLYIIGVLANKLNRSRRLVESFLYKA